MVAEVARAVRASATACSVRPRRRRSRNSGRVASSSRRLDRRSSSTGSVEPDVADRELRRVDADREAARAGVEVVAGQRPLAALVEAAVGVQRERMRGDDGAGAEHGEDVLVGSRASACLAELRRRRGADKGGSHRAAVVLERHADKRPLLLESAARRAAP